MAGLRLLPILLVVALAFAGAGVAPLPLLPSEERGRLWHPPIRITNDAEFLLPTSGVVGGLGTAEDPFVIEGWRLTPLRHWAVGGTPARSCETHTVGPLVGPVPATPWPGPLDPGRAHGIEIRDTTLHVVVRDVYVHGLDPESPHPEERILADVYDSLYLSGIYVENAENVTIEASLLENLYRGICARGATQFRITTSTVRDTSWHAIEVRNGHQVWVDGNDVGRSGSGPRGFGAAAVSAFRTSELVVQGNHIAHITEGDSSAVGLTESHGAEVRRNTLELSDIGVDVFGSMHARIDENFFFGNSRGVLTFDSVISHATNLTLQHNNFVANSAALNHQASGVPLARHNWWGCPEGPNPPATEPDCQKIFVGSGGFVTVFPWLTEPFPTAGAP